MPEYIYIRQVNQSSVHIGRTLDLDERYKLGADQTIEDFKEYLFIFECEVKIFFDLGDSVSAKLS